MKIKDLSERERPRERLMRCGAGALSDSELLAIILGAGIVGASAVDTAQLLLKDAGGTLSGLFGQSAETLQQAAGVGPGRACAVLAVAELGRRFFAESTTVRKVPVMTARMAFDILYPVMKGLSREQCWVLFLNTSNYLISKEKVGEGGVSSTPIDNRRIIRRALDLNATAIILAHNHPGLNPRPSNADVTMTESLREAASAFSISLLDHLILCDDAFFSFADEEIYPVSPSKNHTT